MSCRITPRTRARARTHNAPCCLPSRHSKPLNKANPSRPEPAAPAPDGFIKQFIEAYRDEALFHTTTTTAAPPPPPQHHHQHTTSNTPPPPPQHTPSSFSPSGWSANCLASHAECIGELRFYLEKLRLLDKGDDASATEPPQGPGNSDGVHVRPHVVPQPPLSPSATTPADDQGRVSGYPMAMGEAAAAQMWQQQQQRQQVSGGYKPSREAVSIGQQGHGGLTGEALLCHSLTEPPQGTAWPGFQAVPTAQHVALQAPPLSKHTAEPSGRAGSPLINKEQRGQTAPSFADMLKPQLQLQQQQQQHGTLHTTLVVHPITLMQCAADLDSDAHTPSLRPDLGPRRPDLGPRLDLGPAATRKQLEQIPPQPEGESMGEAAAEGPLTATSSPMTKRLQSPLGPPTPPLDQERGGMTCSMLTPTGSGGDSEFSFTPPLTAPALPPALSMPLLPDSGHPPHAAAAAVLYISAVEADCGEIASSPGGVQSGVAWSGPGHAGLGHACLPSPTAGQALDLDLEGRWQSPPHLSVQEGEQAAIAAAREIVACCQLLEREQQQLLQQGQVASKTPFSPRSLSPRSCASVDAPSTPGTPPCTLPCTLPITSVPAAAAGAGGGCCQEAEGQDPLHPSKAALLLPHQPLTQLPLLPLPKLPPLLPVAAASGSIPRGGSMQALPCRHPPASDTALPAATAGRGIHLHTCPSPGSAAAAGRRVQLLSVEECLPHLKHKSAATATNISSSNIASEDHTAVHGLLGHTTTHTLGRATTELPTPGHAATKLANDATGPNLVHSTTELGLGHATSGLQHTTGLLGNLNTHTHKTAAEGATGAWAEEREGEGGGCEPARHAFTINI